ncbi:hypothetical protein [Thalassotalea sp. Y01]|uniref:hypothetical protein n=1 Tax=Thalassotalea sp. Y01 TaxID=2729613 RepID=UPI00145E84F7|nr:hypothetical protein [Thalassotalea sp. Y01]NMP14740.1 hypothetical protein [Thalassotalea sp. Y01]
MGNTFLTRIIMIPAAVWLSVFFGGSMGSGVELVQYITSNGPIGGFVAIGSVALVVMAVMFCCFELSRRYKAYDYRQFSKVILGKLWWLYEIAILLSMIIVIAISSTAAGTVLGEYLQTNHYVGQVALLAVVIFFTYKGREFIEKSMTIASMSLLLILAIIAGYVYVNLGEIVAFELANDEVSLAAASVGSQYAMVNVAFFPLLLFAGRHIKKSTDSVVASISAAIVGVLPLAALHFAFLSYYPEVLTSGVEVPVYWLLEQLESTWLIDVYVLILFVLILQTGVGMMQGFVERIDNYMQEKHNKTLSATQHAGVAGSMVLLSLALSTLGIVALILAGYKFLFMIFIVVFFIPLFTVGIYKLLKTSGKGNAIVIEGAKAQ